MYFMKHEKILPEREKFGKADELEKCNAQTRSAELSQWNRIMSFHQGYLHRNGLDQATREGLALSEARRRLLLSQQPFENTIMTSMVKYPVEPKLYSSPFPIPLLKEEHLDNGEERDSVVEDCGVEQTFPDISKSLFYQIRSPVESSKSKFSDHGMKMTDLKVVDLESVL